MKVTIINSNGFTKMPTVKGGAMMGVLVKVPAGYEPIVQKPDFWVDGLAAQVIKVLEGKVWNPVPEGRAYDPLRAYCINVEKLKDWYRKQVAVLETRKGEYVKRLTQLEAE